MHVLVGLSLLQNCQKHKYSMHSVYLVCLELKLSRYLCPLNVEWHSPVVVFQSLILLSQLPLAIVDPLELHATEVTLRLR